MKTQLPQVSKPATKKPVPYRPPPKASMLAIVNKKWFEESLKYYQFQGVPGEIFPWSSYESENKHLEKLNGGPLFLVAVRSGEELLLVAIYERTVLTEDGIESVDENTTPITEITHLVDSFEFGSGNGLSALTGQALQTPRVLTNNDEKLLREAVSKAHQSPQEDEEDEELSAFEGDKKQHFVTHRKRESKLRKAKVAEVKKATGKLCCEVPGCGFDFMARYGELGEDYIQVHHKKPLAKLEAPEKTTLDDLVVVCANCHVMIHRRGQCRDWQTLLPGKTNKKKAT